MKKAGLILLLHFISGLNFAQEQGMPLLRNYSPKEFVYDPQVYSVIQDSRGIVYFGITDFGLLEFDGVEWRGIPNKLKSEVYGLVFDKRGTLYIAGTNDFGYLMPDKTGKSIYISLKNQFIDSTLNIGSVWNAHIIDDDVYFFTENCVYIYNIPSKNLKFLRPEEGTSFYVSFIYKNKYYILHETDGIYCLENSNLRLIPKTNFFSRNPFLSVLSYDENTILIPTRTSGLYLVDLSGKKPARQFNLKPTKEFLNDNNIYSSLNVDSAQFLLGSMEKGAILVKKDGEILTYIDEKAGLQNNLVLASAIDYNRNIWLALSLGISKLDTGKDISFWDKSSGLQGNVYDIARFNNLIYLVTNQKIYHLKPAAPIASVNFDIISEIKGIPPGQNWCLTNFKIPGKPEKEILLAGTQSGIFELIGDYSRQIYKGDLHAFQITQSKKYPNRIYSTDGFSDFISLVYKEGNWVFEGKWIGINDDIREIVEDHKGNLWLETFTNGVLYVTIDYEHITKPKSVKRYTRADGLPFISGCKPIEYKNKIIFGTEKGFYIFNEKNNKFEPYSMSCKEFDNARIGVKNFAASLNGNIYISSQNSRDGQIGYLSPIGKGCQWNYKAFKRLPEMASISALLADPDGTVWIGSNEGLYRYDPKKDRKDYNLDFNCLIRKVIIGKDSIVYWGNHYAKSLMQTKGINYNYNNLKFYFSAPFYDHENLTKYSYFLEGYDENWSEWTSPTFKEYTRVKEGRYLFKVKALNIYNKESSVAEYEIQILAPWYRKAWSYALYLLGLVVIFLLVMRGYSQILVKQKHKLEKTVDERTAEIVRQKDEIQSQAEEMATQSEELHEKAVILSQINEELEKLSIVARETDNAITIMDDKGVFLWVNDGFTRLYGYTLQEHSERYGDIFKTCNNKEIEEKIEYCIQSKQSVVYETSLITKSGDEIFIQSTLTPIVGVNGKIEKLVSIDSDISKLKEADFEIKKKNEEIIAQKEELEQHRNHLEQIVKKRTAELEISKNKAEESDRLKSAFLANMSHEIRTPMNAIIGFSGLLCSPDTTPQQKDEFAQLIAHSGNSLLQLIEDIIDIAKIEAGQMKIVKKNCNLNELLISLHELFAQRIETIYRKDIQLVLKNIKEEESLIIETDALRLQQVITNLLENAIKFTENGVIEFGYSLIDVDKDNYVEFFVKDSGIGLSPDEQNIIFDRFTKIENSKTKLYRGAGLGLAICKNIVNLLGGEINVNSNLKKGSTFSFTIPFIESEFGEKSAQQSFSSNYIWNGKTILIAEDEDSNFRFLEIILKETEAKLVRAANGIEVFEKFDDSQIDLILMDIKMPLMNGFDVTRKIRSINKEIPIIALTAFAMQNDENLCLEVGCNSYVSKPIHQELLLSILNKYLG